MANFNISKGVTKSFEGGFWNDPTAGWTYRGITAKNYKSWPGFARIKQLTKGATPPRYTVFKDAALDRMVDDFYNSVFWKNKLTGDKINNQDIANMCYDFILHKENAAITVINNVARTFAPNLVTAKTSLSPDVIKIMNLNPGKFYNMLRTARLNYYKNSPKFSKPMKAAFVKRVELLPETTAANSTSNAYAFVPFTEAF